MKERDYFNGKAEQWDSNMPEKEINRVRGIIQGLPILAGSSVLDVGCGTGIVIPFLRGLVGMRGRLAGIDVAEKMLQKSLSKMPEEHVFYAADVHFMPFSDCTFDSVVCFNCFPHFRNKRDAFIEIHRVLRPGGNICICHSQSREGINALHRNVGDVVKEDRIPDEHEMHSLFAASGYGEITIRNTSFSYTATAVK